MLHYIGKILGFLGRSHQDISEWYAVDFDETEISRDVSPPGRVAYKDQLEWNAIERVMFEATDFLESDAIYLFSKHRPESYLIPMDAKGADKLWYEILDRKLFDAELAIEAAVSEGGFFVWPPAAGTKRP
ncbi:MAG: hypothetical protein ABJ370_22905 [Paracoccaceae bacterium]